MIKRLQLSSTYRPCDVIMHWHRDGQMLLNPPYQRGLVWGQKRKVNLIRSLLLGVPIPSIVINDRFAAQWDDNLSCVVIDGKQRISALLDFFNDVIRIPSEWVGVSNDSGWVAFSEMPLPLQRHLRLQPLPFCEAQLPNLEAEREVFDLINFGGVPQGESDV